MSLLMQALKKAERAKQSHHSEEEPAKPSEAFDSVLELAPQEPLQYQSVAPEPDPVTPPEGLSLSPLDAAPQEPALEFVPQEPPRVEEPAAPPPPPQAKRPRNPPPPPPQPRARPKPRATPVLGARAIRMAALGAGALLAASVFGYIYWHEMYGPGSSRHLPPVPMPGQNLPSASVPAPGGPTLVGPAAIGTSPLASGSFGAPVASSAPAAPELPPAGAASYAQSAPAATGPGSSRGEPPPPGYVAPQATGPGSSRGEPPPDAYMAPQATGPGSSRSNPPPDAYMAGPAAAPASSAPSAASDIRVARASNPERISPGIAAGYGAYQRGDLAGARASYQDALREDPNSRDALLGLAAVSVRAGDAGQAASYYARLLEMDPNDADALAGVASLRSDGAGSESRLRQALSRNPESGPALFALGNLYARQGRWQEAQQHYFRAYTAAPQNPDYAFNLAVGLDRLNQGRLALGYYQKALALAGDAPVSFDRAAAGRRIRELATHVGGQ